MQYQEVDGPTLRLVTWVETGALCAMPFRYPGTHRRISGGPSSMSCSAFVKASSDVEAAEIIRECYPMYSYTRGVNFKVTEVDAQTGYTMYFPEGVSCIEEVVAAEGVASLRQLQPDFQLAVKGQPRKGLLANLLIPAYGDCSNGGLSHYCHTMVIVGEGIPEVIEESAATPAIHVHLHQVGASSERVWRATSAVDPRDTRRPMFGGCYIEGDSRFNELFGDHPVKLFDRYE